MGQKAVEFQTRLSLQECGQKFQSGIKGGRGVSSWIGGLTAMAMGGESLTFYTPQDNSPFATLNNARVSVSICMLWMGSFRAPGRIVLGSFPASLR